MRWIGSKLWGWLSWEPQLQASGRDWLSVWVSRLTDPLLSGAETNQFVYLVFCRCFKCAAMRETMSSAKYVNNLHKEFENCAYTTLDVHSVHALAEEKTFVGYWKWLRGAISSAELLGRKYKCGDLAVWDMDPVTSEALYLNCRRDRVSSIDIGKFWLLAILTTYTSFVTDFLSGYRASKHRHQIILNLVHVQPIVISAQYELTA